MGSEMSAGVTPLLAVTVKVYEPAAVGVPLNSPVVGLMLSPVGIPELAE